MSVTLVTPEANSHAARDTSLASASPRVVWLLLLCILALAFTVGVFATPPATMARAIEAAGPDLTRLLRAMAAIKVVLAAGATAAILWRLGSAVTVPWFAAYAIACAAMAAGPGLIWGMAHPGRRRPPPA